MRVVGGNGKPNGPCAKAFMPILTLLFFVGGVLFHLHERKVSDYPTVIGEVTKAEVHKREVRESMSRRPRSRSGITFSSGSSKRYEYHPEISYGFTVDGKEYKSSNIGVGNPVFKSKKALDTYMAKYPVGQKVAVYYDPAAPTSSYLEVGSHFISLVFFAVSAMFFLVIMWSGPTDGELKQTVIGQE